MRLAIALCVLVASPLALAQGSAPANSQPPVIDRPSARAGAPSAAYDEKVSKARALLKANDPRAALVASQEAIALDDKRWEAYVTAAGAYSSQTLYDDAIGMLQAALVWAPEDRKQSIRDALATTRRALATPSQGATVTPPPAAAAPPTQAEIILWKSIEQSKSVADFQGYLDVYPNGVYAPLAKRHVSTLAAAESPVMVTAFALSTDRRSIGWAIGRDLRETIAQAHNNCVSYAKTSCVDDAYCELRPGLWGAHTWDPDTLGTTIVCNQRTQDEARNAAMGRCGTCAIRVFVAGGSLTTIPAPTNPTDGPLEFLKWLFE